MPKRIKPTAYQREHIKKLYKKVFCLDRYSHVGREIEKKKQFKYLKQKFSSILKSF